MIFRKMATLTKIKRVKEILKERQKQVPFFCCIKTNNPNLIASSL